MQLSEMLYIVVNGLAHSVMEKASEIDAALTIHFYLESVLNLELIFF